MDVSIALLHTGKRRPERGGDLPGTRQQGLLSLRTQGRELLPHPPGGCRQRVEGLGETGLHGEPGGWAGGWGFVQTTGHFLASRVRDEGPESLAGHGWGALRGISEA